MRELKTQLHITLAIFLFAQPLTAGADRDESTIRVAVPNPILSLDPVRLTNAQEVFILPLVYEHLFLGDSNGDIVPELAESWSFDSNSKRLRIRLKEGRHFSDGSPVAAQDVVNSFKRFCDPHFRSSSRLIGLIGCGASDPKDIGVAVHDSAEVEMSISVHPSAFLYQLAFGPAVIMREISGGRVIGSGAFRVDRLEQGRLFLSKNPYYTSARMSWAKSIEFDFIPEHDVPTTLPRGDIDVASMYLHSTAAQVTSADFIKFEHAPYVTQTLVLNPHIRPFNDPVLRHAIAAGIDQSGIANCRPGQSPAYGIIPKGIGGSLPPPPAPSLNKRGQWLAARLKIPTTVTLFRHLERKFSCEEDILTRVFADLNINLKFAYMDDYQELLPKYFDPTTAGYIELFVFMSREPASMLKRFSSQSKEPYFFHTDARFDQQLQDALNKSNIVDRFKTYRDINQAIVDFGNVIPLYYVGHTNIIRKSRIDTSAPTILYNPNSFLFLLQMGKS